MLSFRTGISLAAVLGVIVFGVVAGVGARESDRGRQAAGNDPKWDRREDGVITLGQVLRQMVERNLKGGRLSLDDARLVALEAHVMNLVRSR